MSIQPGVYTMPFAEYLAVDAMSASALKELARSPRHFRLRHRRPETGALRRGSVAHVACLEPDRLSRYVVCPERRVNEKGQDVAFVRNGKHWEDFQAQHQGAEGILSAAEYAEAAAIAAAVAENPAATAAIEGEHEITLIWQDPAWGLCKARLDVLAPAHLADLKTARDISPDRFGWAAKALGYDIQAAWYMEGAARCGLAREAFRFVAVESAHPHDSAVYLVPPDMLAFGRRKIAAIATVYRDALASDYWPGAWPGEQDLAWPLADDTDGFTFSESEDGQ